jgi:hypothetical protein
VKLTTVSCALFPWENALVLNLVAETDTGGATTACSAGTGAGVLETGVCGVPDAS